MSSCTRRLAPSVISSVIASKVLSWNVASIVECGVYKGRQIVMMARTLLAEGVRDRDIYLYDTFAGMTEPGPEDVRGTHRPSRTERGGHSVPLEAVRATVTATGYPPERCHYVVGDVAETLPGTRPDWIALLRLDTDWYASTKHELRTL